ncbi:hypothetical protein SAMN04487993_10671, partial [Salipiger marinus]
MPCREQTTFLPAKTLCWLQGFGHCAKKTVFRVFFLARRQASRSGVVSLFWGDALPPVQVDRSGPVLRWPAWGSVSNLFEAVVSFMVAPIDEDRAITHPTTVLGTGQKRGRWNSSHARSLPAIIALHTVGAEPSRVVADAITVTILMLAELDMVDADAPNEVEGAARDVDIGAFIGLRQHERTCRIREADLRPDGRCCRTQSVKDSHRESMRLDDLHEQAQARPLP